MIDLILNCYITGLGCSVLTSFVVMLTILVISALTLMSDVDDKKFLRWAFTLCFLTILFSPFWPLYIVAFFGLGFYNLLSE